MSSKTSTEVMDAIKGSKIVSVRTTYPDGDERLHFTFENDSGHKYKLTIEAERGSDIWLDLKKVKAK
jgi:penicillin V acylase-like amidase (Ntn superfamily)